MSIDANSVMQLRTQTGAGVMDCKKALAESGGNLEEAVAFLRKKGLAAAEKKAGRATKEGLVEVACETDFVARTDEFQGLVKDLAMHVAAASPMAVSREEIPESVASAERELMRAQVAEMGKPEAVRDKIVEGKMEKWYGEKVLMEQPFVKDPDQKISDLVTAAVAKLGENIQIRRFSRFALGEES
jgi:elongation factor Ts